MMQFGEIVHDYDLSFVIGKLFEHGLVHEFDSNNFILREPIAFKDDSEVTLSQDFRTIDIELVCDFLHSGHFHLDYIKLKYI